MKRVGNLYEKVYDMDNLRLAHKNARRGKGWYNEVKMVDADTDYYLDKISRFLMFQTYHTSKYHVFERKEHNKLRRIHKLPYYPDRIVHWALIQVIEPYLIRTMTADTYSAIPERGVHYGMRRVQNDIENDFEGCKYCLKFDISKYYQSIDHEILKMKFRRMFKDQKLLWLIDEIIDSVPDEEGLPIGNYLSQYCGNLYLSDFDHWIKEVKHVKYYHRYMDDIVIFANDKTKLHELFKEIRAYIEETLNLKIKSNWQVFPTYVRGVDFLGYVFFGSHTLLRTTTKKAMRHKLLKMKDKEWLGEHDRCVTASYSGWTKHANCRHLEHLYLETIQRRLIQLKLQLKIKMEGALSL